MYRLDPLKIPEEGVRARCMLCPGIFFVGRCGDEAADPDRVVAPADGGRDGDGGPALDFEGSAARAAEPARAPGPRDQHLPPAPFGARDPHERAYGLARALVSDIVAYHRERRDRSLRSGTVRREFRAEIHQKWDEYVAQVGNEMARGTSYFRDALNELLAGGVRLF